MWMSTKRLDNAKYHIDAYEAAQKEAVVKAVLKNVPKVVAVKIPMPSLQLSLPPLQPTMPKPSERKPLALSPTSSKVLSSTMQQNSTTKPLAIEPPPLRRSLRLLQN